VRVCVQRCASIASGPAELLWMSGRVRLDPSFGHEVANPKSRFLSGRQSDPVCNIARIMTVSGKPLRQCAAAALLAGIVALAPAWAHATDIKGRVVGYEHLRNPVWMAAKDPERHGYSFREPVTTVPAAMRKLFPQVSKEVCVVALAASPKGPGKPVSVRVSGGRTTPVTLVVAPGTEIRFKNADPFEHRLYGVGLTTLPASSTAKGAIRRWTPQEAGRYELRDELAPSHVGGDRADRRRRCPTHD